MKNNRYPMQSSHFVKSTLVGREEESRTLTDALRSGRPEFIAVFGRRRVGKTFLVRKVLGDHFAFEHTGLANAERDGQLSAFAKSLSRSFGKTFVLRSNWLDAFDDLRTALARKRGRKVIFLDEMPWMDTPRSGFLSALEYFWNNWASGRDDIMLVVCGSATSWIVRKIIDNYGGLHNRLTHRVRLQPFTLGESRAFVNANGLLLTNRQIADLYLVFGGVPFYWSLIRKGESPVQTIDRLCFAEGGELADEFERLYAALFRHPGMPVAIVRALGARMAGLTRRELLDATGLDNCGLFTKTLEDLEHCGFIRRYRFPGKVERDALWQLVDPFTLFHLRFLADPAKRASGNWLADATSPGRAAWSGLAFEQLCLAHVAQIKLALGISGVAASVFAARIPPGGDGEPGAQIDLAIDRADGIVNLCEMKYAAKPFAITEKYRLEILDKVDAWQRAFGARKAVHVTFVTAEGIRFGAGADIVQAEVRLDDLFK